jgi:hypothetical protein
VLGQRLEREQLLSHHHQATGREPPTGRPRLPNNTRACSGDPAPSGRTSYVTSAASRFGQLRRRHLDDPRKRLRAAGAAGAAVAAGGAAGTCAGAAAGSPRRRSHWWARRRRYRPCRPCRRCRRWPRCNRYRRRRRSHPGRRLRHHRRAA